LVKKHKNLPGQKTKNLHDGQKIFNPNLPGQKTLKFTLSKNTKIYLVKKQKIYMMDKKYIIQIYLVKN